MSAKAVGVVAVLGVNMCWGDTSIVDVCWDDVVVLDERAA